MDLRELDALEKEITDLELKRRELKIKWEEAKKQKNNALATTIGQELTRSAYTIGNKIFAFKKAKRELRERGIYPDGL